MTDQPPPLSPASGEPAPTLDRLPVADLAANAAPALVHLAGGLRINLSLAALRAKLDWFGQEYGREGLVTLDLISALVQDSGIRLAPFTAKPAGPAQVDLPLLGVLKDGRAVVITSLRDSRTGLVVGATLFEGSQTHTLHIRFEALSQDLAMLWRPVTEAAMPDSRIDAYIAPPRRHGLREILFPSLRPYGHVMLAALMCNLLALVGVIFSMQVYDRVIPAKSLPTLAVLALGVALAFAFEFVLRMTRASLLDALGKQAGLRLSERVFGRALRIQSTARPPATGSFIAQIRDIDTLRETLTASTVGAVVDLPFFLLFTFIFWLVAGPLVAIPLTALALMLGPALVMQPRLKAAAQLAQRESALRNAVLVEVIQGVDDIKATRSEGYFESIWRRTSRATADASTRQKHLAHGLTTWTQLVQQAVYAGTVAIGAPLVMSGHVTTGTLVGASILGSRMLAPMGAVAGVLARLQQAKIGAAALDELMHKPIDQPTDKDRVALPALTEPLVMQGAAFSYSPMGDVALDVAKLSIKPDERIAILGRNGAGKSTLLQAIAGQLPPVKGRYLVAGHGVETVDPADLRRHLGYLGQNARLFHGTLRENLRLGQPMASDRAMLAALQAAGGGEMIGQLSQGLDHRIAEGGTGLSGGQRQQILLARTLLAAPQMILLDEPTSAMDDAAERAFVAHLGRLAATGKGLVVATHRHRILNVVDRLIVVDRGRVVMDGPKDAVLAKLAEQSA